MTAAHTPFDELAAAYALGALDGEDRTRFEAHLAAGCAACGATLRAYDEALARAAGDLREAPPARVRHALVTRLGSAAPATSRARLRWRLVAAQVVGMAAAAGVAVWLTSAALRARYEPELAAVTREANSLRAQLEEQGKTLVSLRAELAEQERALVLVRAESAEQGRTLALLQAPDTRVVTLAGLAPSPAARARMLWHPREGGVLVTADLPPVPAGKVYELWAIAAGKPVPVGVFAVDAAGRATVRVAALPDGGTVDVFAVTLEPAGGVPAPTGAMYLASKTA